MEIKRDMEKKCCQCDERFLCYAKRLLHECGFVLEKTISHPCLVCEMPFLVGPPDKNFCDLNCFLLPKETLNKIFILFQVDATEKDLENIEKCNKNSSFVIGLKNTPIYYREPLSLETWCKHPDLNVTLPALSREQMMMQFCFIAYWHWKFEVELGHQKFNNCEMYEKDGSFQYTSFFLETLQIFKCFCQSNGLHFSEAAIVPYLQGLSRKTNESLDTT